MLSSPKYRGVVQAVESERTWNKEVFLSPGKSSAQVWGLLFRHRKYFLWLAAIQSLELFEVALLTFKFKLQFTGDPLFVLRVLSSFGLVPLLGALTIRSEARWTRVREKDPNRCLMIAQLLFVTGLILSVIALTALFGFSQLALTSPPIFRAVLASACINLPFQVFSVFLLFHLFLVRKEPFTRELRHWTIVILIFAEGALFLNIPLLYLTLRVLPLLLLSLVLWRFASRRSFVELFLIDISALRRTLSSDPSFFTALAKTFAMYGILEAAFFLLFAEVSSGKYSLLVYFLQKFYHLSWIFSLRSGIALGSRLSLAVRTRCRAISLKLVRVLRDASIAVLTVLLLLFTPLFLWRQEFFVALDPWMLEFQFEPYLLAALLLLLTARSLLGTTYVVFSILAALHAVSGRALFAGGALLLCVVYTAFSLIPTLVFQAPLAVVFLGACLVDSLICFGLGRWALRLLKETTQTGDTPRKGGLAAFLTECVPQLERGSVSFVTAELSYPLKLAELSKLKKKSLIPLGSRTFLMRTDKVSPWGLLAKELPPGEIATASHHTVQRAEELAPLLLPFTAAPPESDAEILEKDLAPDGLPAKLQLLESAASGAQNGAYSSSEHFEIVVHQDGDWPLYSIPSLELRELFFRFLSAIDRSGDTASPHLWDMKAAKGFFHLCDSSGRVSVVGWMRPELRQEHLAAVRRWCFQQNGEKLLGGVGR